MRTVMCVNDWPEDGEVDFQVTDVKPGEADADALARAKKMYADDCEFYIVEDDNVSKMDKR